MDIEDIAKKVKNKNDFINFLKLLNENLCKENWANNDLSSFLDGMEGFVHDMEGFYKNYDISYDENSPKWSDFALILLAARVYE